jgi:hypothetical protein
MKIKEAKMSKQTAVDYLWRKLFPYLALSEERSEDYKRYLKEAQAIEKKQIENANRDGVDMVVNKENFITGEQYYNETYGGENAKNNS